MRNKMTAAAMTGLLAVLLSIAGFAAEPAQSMESAGQVWDKNREVSCAEGSVNCCLLQMIMMGEFDDFHPEDMVNIRVYSAAFSLMRDITQEDLEHFAGEFGEDTETVEQSWYQAMADCLLADITCRHPQESSATDPELVLLLFLKPAQEEEEREEQQKIRERMTDDMAQLLAEAVEVPPAFVKWLIGF